MVALPFRPLLAAPLLLAGVAHAQCEVQALRTVDASDQARFGAALSAAGDRLLVGAPRAQVGGVATGAAYVYERSADGWERRQRLTDPIGLELDSFGSVLALGADSAFVASPFSGPSVEGRVLVFEHDGSAFTLAQTLTHANAAVFDLFGISLALDGGTLLVGALGKQAVHVFEDTGASWTETQVLHAFGSIGGPTYFGGVVALDGDRAVVATKSTVSNHPGWAYTFARTGNTWGPDQQLVPSDGQPADGFGSAVAIEGDTLLVASASADGAALDAGAVYVFERGPGGWVETDKLAAADGAPNDFFGASLDLRGERLIVGASGADLGAGAAYLYERSGGSWEPIARLDAPDASLAAYGAGAALAADRAFVGAPWEDGAADQSGSVRVVSAPESARPYGFCVAGAPCGNGQPYAGCAGSTGAGARLAAGGSTSLAADDLVLCASDLPRGAPAVLLASPARQSLPFGDGLLAVGGAGSPILRIDRGAADGSGSLRTLPAGPFGAGETWHFQLGFADAGGPCASGSNLSNALRVTFTP